MQYRLSTIFLVFFVVAASLALFDVGGIWVAAFFLLAALLLNRSYRLSGGLVCAGVSCFLATGGMLWPAARAARENAQQSCSVCPLKMVGLGLLNYHDRYKQFPPLCTTDADGRPLFSWRVEVLPFLEYDALYKGIDKAKPWDSPENQQVLARCGNDTPFTLRACSSTNDSGPNTDYMAVIGPGTALRKDRPVVLSELPDKGSHTVMLVEVADSGTPWTAPRDLTVDEALEGMKAGKGLRISTTMRKQTNVLFADGYVRYLPTKMPLSLWRRILAGEPVDFDNLQAEIDPDAPDMVDVSLAPKRFEPGKFGIYCSVVVWLFSIVLLFRRAVRSRTKPDMTKPDTQAA